MSGKVTLSLNTKSNFVQLALVQDAARVTAPGELRLITLLTDIPLQCAIVTTGLMKV